MKQNYQKLLMPGNPNSTNLRVLLVDIHCQTVMSGVVFRVAVKAYYFLPQKLFLSFYRIHPTTIELL